MHLLTKSVSNISNSAILIPANEHPPIAQILIVDDSVLNQSIALKLLSSLGYAADIASDGQNAIDACSPISKWENGASPYQLIFMDCDMPRVDGYQATKAIRKLEQQAHARYESAKPASIAIVALTTNATAIARERAFASGMDAFLTKPVTSEILLQTVTRWLPLHQACTRDQSFTCDQSEHYYEEEWLSASSSSMPNPSDASGPNDSQVPVQNPTNVNIMSVPLPQSSRPSLSLAPPSEGELHLTHLDWAHLHTLSDYDSDFEMTLLELFVEDCQPKLPKLREAIAQTDITKIESLSHYIKGASANIGAQYMQHYAHQIEQQVRHTQLACLDLEMNRLETAFSIVQDIWAAQG